MDSADRPKPLPILLAIIALAGFVYVGYPFFFDEPRAGAEFHSNLGTYAMPHRVGLERFTGSGLGVLFDSLRSYDPALGILALLGLLALLVGWRAVPGTSRVVRERLPSAGSVLVLPAFAYLVVIGAYGNSFERFVIPLLPFIALLATLGLAGATRLIVMPLPVRGRTAIGGVLVSGVLAFTLWPCARLAQLHALPDVYEQTARWVEENVEADKETVLSTPLINLPLNLPIAQADGYHVADSPLKLIWMRYLDTLEEGALRAPAAPVWPLGPGGRVPIKAKEYPRKPAQVRKLLRELRGNFLIVQRGHGAGKAARQVAAASGKLVKSFSPWEGERRSDFGLTYTADSFREDVLAASCLGPILEVWALKGNQRRL